MRLYVFCISRVCELNSKTNGKADINGTRTLKVEKEVSLNPASAYLQAQFLSQVASNSDSAPGYGFHKPGAYGAFFYYKSGYLWLLTHDGHLFKLEMTEQET